MSAKPIPTIDAFPAVTRDDVDDLALLPRRFHMFSVQVLETLSRMTDKLDQLASRISDSEEDRDELRRSIVLLEANVAALGAR